MSLCFVFFFLCIFYTWHEREKTLMENEWASRGSHRNRTLARSLVSLSCSFKSLDRNSRGRKIACSFKNRVIPSVKMIYDLIYTSGFSPVSYMTYRWSSNLYTAGGLTRLTMAQTGSISIYEDRIPWAPCHCLFPIGTISLFSFLEENAKGIAH